MFTLSNLVLCFTRLAIIKPDTSITSNTDEGGAIGTESGAVDELFVLASQTGVEFEWGSVVEDHACVIGTSSCTQRTLLSDGDTVDLRAVAGDLTNTVAAVCSDAVSEALFAITDGNDALRVTVPGNVVDTAGDNVVFTCKLSTCFRMFQLVRVSLSIPLVAPSPTQSHTLTLPETSPLAT